MCLRDLERAGRWWAGRSTTGIADSVPRGSKHSGQSLIEMRYPTLTQRGRRM